MFVQNVSCSKTVCGNLYGAIYIYRDLHFSIYLWHGAVGLCVYNNGKTLSLSLSVSVSLPLPLPLPLSLSLSLAMDTEWVMLLRNMVSITLDSCTPLLR